jgi:hypothetical protein
MIEGRHNRVFMVLQSKTNIKQRELEPLKQGQEIVRE